MWPDPHVGVRSGSSASESKTSGADDPRDFELSLVFEGQERLGDSFTVAGRQIRRRLLAGEQFGSETRFGILEETQDIMRFGFLVQKGEETISIPFPPFLWPTPRSQRWLKTVKSP